jgi:hypothetical protein
MKDNYIVYQHVTPYLINLSIHQLIRRLTFLETILDLVYVQVQVTGYSRRNLMFLLEWVFIMCFEINIQ